MKYSVNQKTPNFVKQSIRHVLAKCKAMSALQHDCLSTAYKRDVEVESLKADQNDLFRPYLVSQAVDFGLWFLLQYVFWLFIKSYKICDPVINISKML